MCKRRDGIDIPVRLLHDLAVKLHDCATARPGEPKADPHGTRLKPSALTSLHSAAAKADGRLDFAELEALIKGEGIAKSDAFIRIYRKEDFLRVTRLVATLMDHRDVAQANIESWFGGSRLPQIMTLMAHGYGSYSPPQPTPAPEQADQRAITPPSREF